MAWNRQQKIAGGVLAASLLGATLGAVALDGVSADTSRGTGLIGNRIWKDTGVAGVYEPGIDAGLPGVPLALLGIGGNVLATTTTGADGIYEFPNLAAGGYMVKIVTMPAGCTLVAPNATADKYKDSDFLPASSSTPLINLANGAMEYFWDGGLKCSGVTPPTSTTTTTAPATTTTTQATTTTTSTTTTTAAPGATIGDTVWYDVDKDGRQGGVSVPAKGITVGLYNSAGALLSAVDTDAAGKYKFTGLAAGSYTVRLLKVPTQCTLTAVNVGDDAGDSDFAAATMSTGLINVAAGTNDQTIDAGLVCTPITGTNTVKFVPNVDTNVLGVSTYDKLVATTTRVPTILLDSDGVPRMYVAATPPNYAYTGLAAGNYTVQMVSYPFTSPSCYITTPLVGQTDAYVINPTTMSGTVTAGPLGSKPSLATVGISCLPTGNAGIDVKVWWDAVRNGIQDEPDRAIPTTVVVNLYQGNTLLSTAAATGGSVQFQNLAPGSYRLTAPMPHGCALTIQNAGLDDTRDSDFPAGSTVVFNVPAGTIETSYDLGIICGLD
jgi:hypothetical protein